MKNLTNAYICKSCGGNGPVQFGVHCSSCGNRKLVLKAEKGKYNLNGNSAGFTIEGDPNNLIGRRVERCTRSGGIADSYIRDDHSFLVKISNPIKNSNDNERKVAKVLVNKLISLDQRANIKDGSQDARGEDGKLLINGVEFDLQIVTSLGSKLWEDLNSEDEASLDGDIVRAVSLIRNAIVKKSERYPEVVKEQMILALDLTYAGALVHKKYVSDYILNFGDPKKEYSFHAVWLVGPTERSTMQLSPLDVY